MKHSVSFQVGLSSDVGIKRQKNQDNALYDLEIGLFMVADGMGGHLGGETASRMAIQTVHETLSEQFYQNPTLSIQQLTTAFEKANRSIYETSQRLEHLTGMGTTATAILFSQDMAYIAHIGDSRCYLIREKEIWQLTRDHRLVEEKVKAKLIHRDQMNFDRMRNILTRSVGFAAEINIEQASLKVLPEDLFLLCSDGLSGMITNQEILRYLLQETKPQSITQQLIAVANQKGGEDNITCVLIKKVP